MKKLIAVLILASLAFAGALMADTSLWSDSFHFDGNAITEEPILLNPTDPLAYSSAMTEGEPKSLKIIVEDTINPEIAASIFTDYSATPVEGTATWDYTADDYKDFPTDDTYLLVETIVSDTEYKLFSRLVTILPEPTGLLLLGLAAAFFLRKRAKSLLAVVALIALSAFSAKAESSVTEVKCMQMWPFDRSVIINFTIDSDNPYGLEVKFYGSTDNGETSFDLTEKGTLTKDGSDGTLPGAGKYKAIWMPNETFYGLVTDDMKVRVEIEEVPPPPSDLYMVIDLTSGDISYLDSVPEGGWTYEHKTTKMVLRKIQSGKFIMGSPIDELGRYPDELQHEVTLTKDFFIGVFETTQGQYKTITGSNPSYHSGNTRPVECVSFNMIRGAEKGAGWPADSDVDEESFLGKLRAKTSKDFDLPTEAQWEYACRAKTTTALNDGSNLTNRYEDGNMNKLGRYSYNGGENEGTAAVGSYLPNKWGLYDMHGNVWEWCLDWWDYNSKWSSDPVTDPVGPAEGTQRYLRSGSCYYGAGDCRSAYRGANDPSYNTNSGYGFRVVLVP